MKGYFAAFVLIACTVAVQAKLGNQQFAEKFEQMQKDLASNVTAPNVESCGDMKSLVTHYFPRGDANIMLCIAFYESSYRPTVRNPSGATGLFQIMPSHCGEPGCPRGSGCIGELERPSTNAA